MSHELRSLLFLVAGLLGLGALLVAQTAIHFLLCGGVIMGAAIGLLMPERAK